MGTVLRTIVPQSQIAVLTKRVGWPQRGHGNPGSVSWPSS